MRSVFLGTPESAVPALEALLEAGHAVDLVVTRPDRPVGRSRRPTAPPVKLAAERHGIELLQPERVRASAFVERLRVAMPEVLVVVAYGRILPRSVLDVAPHGAINLHFSLLPAYRGAAPVQWALANGDATTGVTTMQIDEKMDEGDILLQREVAVESGEHAPSMQSRLAQAGSELLVETLARIEAGNLEPRCQNHAEATYAPMLTAADGEIDFDLEARQVEGRIRGFDPWPGIWVRRAGRRLRLVEGRALAGTAEGPPGLVLDLTTEGLVVVCGGGSRLAVRRVQPEGKRVLDVRDAVNGRQIVTGDRLEPCS